MRQERELVAAALRERDLRRTRQELTASQLEFTRRFFAAKEGQDFVTGPHHEVMARTLDRVISGEITRLIINVPPGYTKTEMAVVHFMARGFAINPQARFIHASYAGELALLNSNSVRDVIKLDEYQELWPVAFNGTIDAKGLWRTTDAGGVRAAPAASSITGFRAGLMTPGFTGALIIDDPLKPDDAESELERPKVNARWHSTFKSRLAIERVPVIVIMQRLHIDDFSGYLLRGGAGCKWHHLMLPIMVDNKQPYPQEFTHGIPIPHGLPDGPLWPVKHTVRHIEELRHDAYTFAAQYMQVPEPERGAGILKREWWRAYKGKGKDNAWPAFEYVLASLDTAYTEKQENDFSALTVWGIYVDSRGVAKALLIAAWQERLAIHDLVTKVHDTLKGLQVDKLLIESKASGISVEQELRRLYRSASYSLQMINPGRIDKVARAHAIAHLFHEGLIEADYLNGLPTPEADMVISQCARFPHGSHDDLVDSLTQALSYLRQISMLNRAVEVEEDEREAITFKGNASRTSGNAIYPV